ncbi:MAG: hypothetical protein CLLPBCKN_005163 [Chroococcidiopsis cubana SAG 39.79]|uniref:Outer membrane protein beta-barrel domain-containing protein n=1 Tax=Chroococcidiopsis cubana SAG 39.79 TaxID=388085 RepID=A0AB37UCA8_9CYAN|nr:hypothetical protein [Chroococcidiopsis cubana]MDZ4875743.1 hypothetical protein [Chroococcidiopsis cubana SAG 39.79]PSB63421.1 hypothetical protein C7B79_13980 [Chroococcidiopsis cubana CCALA 043]RUT04950.1 hypothetical protein DSM107010_56360 [Chroococcidiopsis cubana SAG 39.79]
MNAKPIQQIFVAVGIATVAVLAGGLSAQAQTANSNPTQDTKVSTSAAALRNDSANSTVAQVDPTYPSTQPTTPTTEPPATTPETTPTQTTPGAIEPGRATRGGSSYVGVGGNIGLGGGDTALGIGNFTVISKIGFTEAVSVRPAVVFGDNTTFLIPITYDFTVQPTGAATEAISSFAPYVGGGLAIATGDNSDVGPMLTAGADVPLGDRLTANAGVNVGFFDSTSVGLTIGVGYNFEGL